MKKNRILYSRQNGLVVLKFVGYPYRIDTALDQFLSRIFEEKNFQNVLIDLTQATSIDSTNLGLLAKVTRFMQQEFKRKAAILSTNENVNAILEQVGFEDEFVIIRQPGGIEFDFTPLAEEDASEEELVRTVLEAHKALTALNANNATAYQEVVASLELESAGNRNE